MNPALFGIWEHMRDLGLGALAHANRHAAYSDIDNSKWPELSVLQAAHSAELLIKARIAQEHPLLIFDKLPRSSQVSSTSPFLDLKGLLTNGHTFEWSELPERLWAVTGITLPQPSLFKSFGNLRNGLQHFSSNPQVVAADETLRFIFNIIDPFINDCWGLYAVDYDEDSEPYVYYMQALVNREILFLVSPEAAATFDYWDVDWFSVSPTYSEEMFSRVQKARNCTNAKNQE